MKQTLKKIARIAIILLLMAGTLTTFVFMGLDSRKAPEDRMGARKNKTSSVTNAAESMPPDDRSLVMAEERFSLGTGESCQCSVLYDDGNFPEGLSWSSSDTDVSEVDGTGRVTAVAPGRADITASLPNGLSASVKVTVYSDPRESAATAVNALAVNGSDEAMQNIRTLAETWNMAKSDSAKNYAALMNVLLQFYTHGEKGSGSAPDLWKALKSASLAVQIPSVNEGLLRRAALSAYCHGEKDAADVTVSFTGDCTFGYFNETDIDNMFPSVYRNSGSVTYPFDLTKNVFGADDITMINFEGTLTESTEHKDKTFYFRGEPSYVDILTHSSVEAVTLENNHSYDYFEKGYLDTFGYLKEAGIRCALYHSPAPMTVGDYRVAMIALSMVGTNYTDEFRSTVEQYINQYRDSRTVIVLNVHWGVESSDTPEAWQIEAAHSMIDAGADLIIGHHPHVVQGIEVYKGHYIAYSLGNFSFGGNSASINPESMIFRASFSKNANCNLALSRVSVVPCYTTSSGSTSNNFKPTPLYGSTGKAVIDKIISLSAGLEGGVTSLTWSRIP